MTSRVLTVVCVVALLAAFAIDLVTPQLIVAAILLDVPIVLSTYAGNRRFTGALIVCALLANAIAGYVNGIQEGGAWDAVGLANRALAALSIVLAGMLGLAVHRGAERTGAAAALREQVRRERALREAAERIRGSLSEALVERGIAREARSLLAASRASFFLGGAAAWGTRFDAFAAGGDVVEVHERPGSEILSVLIRALEMREPLMLSRDDAVGRLVLDGLEAESGLVAPLIDSGRRFGAILISLDRVASPEDLRALRAYAESAAITLAQARLFVELAAKNDQLAQRSDVIRDIVYALSHDLRTPLSAAGLTLRQAQNGEYGPMPPPYLDILERSVAANDELQRLAETLLLVARYESGDRSTVRVPVDLSAMVRSAIAQLASLAKSKKLAVEIDVPDGGFVSGDGSELRRAVVNLFANAVAWSPEGSRISVRVERDRGMVRAIVADEGYGVPQEMRDALFTRFGSEGRRGAGTGLGLYIVRRIVEDHAGRVRYAPNEPRGSVFTIELPEPPIAERARGNG